MAGRPVDIADLAAPQAFTGRRGLVCEGPGIADPTRGHTGS